MQTFQTPTPREQDYYDVLGKHYFKKDTLVMRSEQYRWLIEYWANFIKNDIMKHLDKDGNQIGDPTTIIERSKLKIVMTKPPEGLL